MSAGNARRRRAGPRPLRRFLDAMIEQVVIDGGLPAMAEAQRMA